MMPPVAPPVAPHHFIKSSTLIKETFQRVQGEMARRKGQHATGGTVFSGKVYCGDCGQIYGSKVWHSNDPYRRVVWRCNDKFKSSNGAGGESKAKCTTPTLTEEQLKEAFDRLLAKLAVDKEVRIRNLWDVYKQVGDVSDLEGEKAEIIAQRDEISDLVQQAIRQNATVAQDQEAYNNHYDGLALKDAELAWKIGELEEMMVERGRKAERVETFIRSLEMAGEMFSEELWCTMVERVKVERDGKMMFTLTCGMDVEV